MLSRNGYAVVSKRMGSILKNKAVNDEVNVGGCVGIICDITNDIVKVKGKYYYVGNVIEHWCFAYKLNIFNQAEWNKEYNEWNADRDGIEPFDYYA